MRRITLAIFATLAAFGQSANPVRVAEYPSALVREEQTVVVDGVSETWRLQWAAKPKPACKPSEDSLTCPCEGFAYGEAGDLFLVRLRNGHQIDRLRLTRFFTEWSGAAVVQRWPTLDRDLKVADRRDFPARVGKRPTVQVMHFADYDHDGRATEFYLQTETVPCGKSHGVIIGLSKNNPRLHVFGTVSNPNKPLYMQKREWEAVVNAQGPVDVLDWACGDHNLDTETRVRLYWTPKGIDGISREYTCPPTPKRLIRQKPLSVD
jgi:hypothetical protein